MVLHEGEEAAAAFSMRRFKKNMLTPDILNEIVLLI
jgi:hypothetical protein